MTTDQAFWEEALRRCDAGDFAAAIGALPAATVDQSLFFRNLLCRNLLQRRMFSALEGLVTHLETTTPRYAPDRMLIHLWRGYLQERAGEHMKAVSSFHNATYVHRNHALHHPPLSLRETFDLGSTLSFECGLALDPMPLPDADWDLPADAAEQTGRVLLLAANDVYIDEFLDETLSSLEETGDTIRRVHIHTIGLELNADALRQTYPSLSIGLSREPVPLFEKQADRLVWYAASRFLRAGACMDHYQADLLVTDIDALFTPAFHTLTPVLESADVALFHDPVQFPWLRYLAGVVGLKNTPATRGMLDLFLRSISDRLPLTSQWMLDQSALYTAIRFAEQRHGLTVAGIGQATGLSLPDVLITPTDRLGKTNLRDEA